MESMPISQELTQDVLCIGCGYNLRGLDASGRCPECGLSIADSTRGHRLIFADPAWLRKLRFGTSLKLWNILISILGIMFVGLIMGIMRGPISLAPGVGIVAAILGLWATYCITSQEPRTALVEDPVTLRKTIRFCAVIGFAGGLANQFVGPAMMGTSRGFRVLWIVASVLTSIAGMIVMVGELKYFRQFALRAPDPKLARSTRILMWIVAVGMSFSALMAALAAFIFGPVLGPGGFSGITASTNSQGNVRGGVMFGGVGGGTPGAGSPVLFGVGMCIFSLVALGFFIWYVVLLSRYKKLFNSALDYGRHSES